MLVNVLCRAFVEALEHRPHGGLSEIDTHSLRIELQPAGVAITDQTQARTGNPGLHANSVLLRQCQNPHAPILDDDHAPLQEHGHYEVLDAPFDTTTATTRIKVRPRQTVINAGVPSRAARSTTLGRSTNPVVTPARMATRISVIKPTWLVNRHSSTEGS